MKFCRFLTVVILPIIVCHRADSQLSVEQNAGETAEEIIHGEDGEEELIVFDPVGVLDVGMAKEKPTWDPKGYIMFCPCMGRFGNQAEHYLGALAFAKAIDRTLVLPAFRTYINVPFSDWFQVEPLKEFHRIIPMEEFMESLADEYWPPGKRKGFCWLPSSSPNECKMKDGNPFGPFWDGYNIDFDIYIKFQMYSQADISQPHLMQTLKEDWDDKFPVSEHPVIAFRGAPASFPMMAGNRKIQNYFHWNPSLFSQAETEINKLFNGEKFVGIHIRNGIDWKRACEHAAGSPRFMASPQCLGSSGDPVTKEMCYPTLDHVLQLTTDAVKKTDAKHLYIATDSSSYLEDFEKKLQPLGVKVHHLNPHLPQMDLMILGQSDYFIGNCVSSFTSFVKRERDARDKPSTFWSFSL